MKNLINISALAPSITDWISACSALIGIPLIVLSFVKLLLKDRDKQKRLVAIESIAINQDKQLITMQEQVEQLSKHTSEFRNQTFLMRESNEIINKQFELQKRAYENSKNIKKQELELEKRKHLITIRPFFSRSGGKSNGNEFDLIYENGKAEAHNVLLKGEENGNFIFQPLHHKVIKNGGVLYLRGKSKIRINSIPSELLIFEVCLEFSDNEGNRYSQKISRLANASFEIDMPIPK